MPPGGDPVIPSPRELAERVGVSSNEGAAKKAFRGSVVSLNPNNGKLNWQQYLITDEEKEMGSFRCRGVEYADL